MREVMGRGRQQAWEMGAFSGPPPCPGAQKLLPGPRPGQAWLTDGGERAPILPPTPGSIDCSGEGQAREGQVQTEPVEKSIPGPCVDQGPGLLEEGKPCALSSV